MSSRERRLKPWEEVIGTYQGKSINDYRMTLTLSLNGNETVFLFSTEGLEAEILKRSLAEYKIGTKISLLKTDDLSRPILIRRTGK